MSKNSSAFLRDPFEFRNKEIVLHNNDFPDSRGALAMKILDHFALISCDENGVDEAGRQKLRLLTPEEVAKRACDLAAAFYDELERRDWLIESPPFEALIIPRK